MTSKREQRNKRGPGSEKGNGNLPAVSGRTRGSEIGSSNSIRRSGGYLVKCCSRNTVTNGEGLCLASGI